jgi:hypothetical protein
MGVSTYGLAILGLFCYFLMMLLTYMIICMPIAVVYNNSIYCHMIENDVITMKQNLVFYTNSTNYRWCPCMCEGLFASYENDKVEGAYKEGQHIAHIATVFVWYYFATTKFSLRWKYTTPLANNYRSIWTVRSACWTVCIYLPLLIMPLFLVTRFYNFL